MTYALTGAFLMSLDAVFVRLSGLPGFAASFLFGAFSLVSMGVLTGVRENGVVTALRGGGLIAILSGMIMGVSGTSFVWAVQHTTVANVVLIQSLSPFFAAFFSWILLREKADRITVAAMVSSLVGMIVIVHGSLGGELAGDLVAVLCSMAASLNYVVWRRYSGISRSLVIGLGGAFIALFSSFFADFSGFDARGVLVMAAMGLLTAPVGRTLMATAARFITAMEIGVIGRINVVVAPLIVWLLFAEVPGSSTFNGGAIVLATILIHASVKMRSARAVPAMAAGVRYAAK